jgi:FAD/FMN-containing dehydrogenase
MTPTKPPSRERRKLLKLAGLPLVSNAWLASAFAAAPLAPPAPGLLAARVRPGDADWPSPERWKQFAQPLGDAFIEVHSPLEACLRSPASDECAKLFKSLKNPYFLGDEVALTQTLGWVDAWTTKPSVYAVAARHSADVVAAVNFAHENRLRLVVKGGGHSYQGTSNAADSLLLWTRRMTDVRLHDGFVAEGCEGTPPTRAVSVGAGALWSHVYDAVTTQAGGYVQGGGCMTVGVAGLVQSGGFGSFSKAFGTAAGNLLEAEVVTADGAVRIANARMNPDLFWALKGGGGGAFGVVTRLTLRVHALPETFGAVNLTIRAATPEAFRRLIGMAVGFCAGQLVNPHWGEQLRFRGDDTMAVSMVFQGLTRGEALAVWQPFLDAVGALPELHVDFAPFKIVSTSAREFWAPTLVKRMLGFVASDDRPGAPKGNLFWPGDQGQAGQVLHGYGSTWLPATLLAPDRQAALGDAIFAATRHWGVALHLNKGLAGAPPEAIARARDTATNPAVLDAFALLITGAEEAPAYPGMAGHEPNAAKARRDAAAIGRAMAEMRRVAPEGGAYVSESDYFQTDWQRAFWGDRYARLLAVKEQLDPGGLFFAHHGVGSERWSDDGFTPRDKP